MATNCDEIEGEFCRGRMYERYQERREAKLREDWFHRMELKEAQIHATWHQLEKSQPSDCSSSTVGNIQEVSKVKQEEKRASKRTSLSKEAINNSSSSSLSSSPRILSRSRTVNTEPKENKRIILHQRRKTLGADLNFDGKISSSKPFLKKGSGIGPGLGPSIVRQRSNMRKEESDAEYEFGTCDYSVSSSFESAESLSTDGLARLERKKWTAPEKIEMFYGERKTLKDEGKLGFKRLLLNIVGRSKTRDNNFVSYSGPMEVGGRLNKEQCIV